MGVPTRTMLLLLVILAGYSQATRTPSFSTSFSIDSQLTCHVPFVTRSGFMAIPEETLTVPIRPGDPYTPQPSGYQLPHGEPNQAALAAFLGTDLACFGLTSVERRTGQVEGYPMPADGIPVPEEGFDNDTRAAIQMFLGTTGQCPVNRMWTELESTFFPRYYAAGVCDGSGCSLPAGMRCLPDSRLSQLRMCIQLRWDCCHSFIARSGRFAFECGWRKVRIPFLSSCACACSPRQ